MKEKARKLKQLAKKAAYWTVPAGIQSAIGKAVSRISAHHKNAPPIEPLFARNARFRDIHKGKRCFILGTGPSVNKQDLRPLRDEICFAVSMFFLHKGIKEIDPLYHVDAPNHRPFRFDVIKGSFEGFEKFYSDRTAYFFGHTPYQYSVFNFLEENPRFKKDNICYLNYSNSPPLDETNYNNPNLWDICKTLFSARTVIYSAIEIAAYMGFKDIYLLGCDHDYLTDVTRGKSEYFYKDEKSGFNDSALWISTEDFFLAYHIRWKQYRLIREFLASKGSYIYNATEGGLLDVFPRVTLAEALLGKDERMTKGNG